MKYDVDLNIDCQVIYYVYKKKGIYSRNWAKSC